MERLVSIGRPTRIVFTLSDMRKKGDYIYNGEAIERVRKCLSDHIGVKDIWYENINYYGVDCWANTNNYQHQNKDQVKLTSYTFTMDYDTVKFLVDKGLTEDKNFDQLLNWLSNQTGKHVIGLLCRWNADQIGFRTTWYEWEKGTDRLKKFRLVTDEDIEFKFADGYSMLKLDGVNHVLKKTIQNQILKDIEALHGVTHSAQEYLFNGLRTSFNFSIHAYLDEVRRIAVQTAIHDLQQTEAWKNLKEFDPNIKVDGDEVYVSYKNYMDKMLKGEN